MAIQTWRGSWVVGFVELQRSEQGQKTACGTLVATVTRLSCSTPGSLAGGTGHAQPSPADQRRSGASERPVAHRWRPDRWRAAALFWLARPSTRWVWVSGSMAGVCFVYSSIANGWTKYRTDHSRAVMRGMRALRLASNGLRTRVRLRNTESNWRRSWRWGTVSR